LDTPIALRDFGVIGLGDRAFLRAKCGRRALANILDRFRLDPALRRHWISNGRDLLQIRDNMRERFSAYVSRDAVADAISRTELRARFGPPAQQIVAETSCDDYGEDELFALGMASIPLRDQQTLEEMSGDGARTVVVALAAELAAAPRLDRERFRAVANQVKARTGQKGKALFHPIRVVLTGRTEGPELDLAVPAIDRGAELPSSAGLPAIVGNRERAAAFAHALSEQIPGSERIPNPESRIP